MEPWGEAHEAHEAELADQLGLDVTEFVERFGADWEPAAAPGVGSSCAPDVDGGSPWYVTGEPAQLMLRVTGLGQAVVARPVGRWSSWDRPSYEPADARVLVRDPAADARTVAALVRARRSSFRYCTLCRRLTPPEHREGSECMSCQSRWRGVVH